MVLPYLATPDTTRPFEKYKDTCRQFFSKFDAYVPQLRTLLTENFEIIGN